MPKAKPLIILDRDGVINIDSDDYVKSVDEWRPIDGSIQAIAELKQQGYKVAIATNQSGIARGYFELSTLESMHQKLRGLLAELDTDIDTIAFCPHGPDDDCSCRKPLPGLLEQISLQLGSDLSQAYMVGDSLRDLQAGRAKNCRCVLVKTGKGQKTWKKIVAGDEGDWPNLLVYDSLKDFSKALINGDLM